MGLNPKFDLQPEVLPTAAEVTTVTEAPKAQESRKKRKQENRNVTVKKEESSESSLQANQALKRGSTEIRILIVVIPMLGTMARR